MMEPDLCVVCGQITNHDEKGNCLKCKAKKEAEL